MEDYTFDFNEYRNRVKIKRGFPFVLIIGIVIALLILAVFIRQTNNQSTTFYFVETNTCLNYSNANSLALEIQSKGGAGYIYYDGTYHVLVSFYSSEEEAKSVVNNIIGEYSSARVLKIEANKFKNISSLSKDENKKLEDMVKKNLTTISSLQDAIIRLDKDEISLSSFNVILSDISSSFSRGVDEFNNYSTLKSYNKYLVKMEENLESLINASSENNNSKIKYYMIKIVINNINFLKIFEN